MRKISIKRIILALIAVFAVILVVPVGYLIWVSWVTPFEKPALLSALDRSEKLESCTSDVGSDYQELAINADRSMAKAEQRALSEYDHQLLMIAQMQLKSAKAICTLRRKATSDPRYVRPLAVVESVQGDGYKMLRSHLQ